MRKKWILSVPVMAFLFAAVSCQVRTKDEQPRRLEILFLGHKNNRHHDSEKLAGILLQEYFKKGINITFTAEPDDLNEANLAHYDGLILYANHDSISHSQE